jgi:uncharacterized protein DUF3592
MNVGVNYRSVIAGIGWILCRSAVLLGYAFLVARPLEPSGYSGSQILLMFFSPVVLGGWVYFAVRGMMHIWSGLTRYTLDDLELIARTPLWSRVVRWSSVASFVLPPATFPRAPEKLVLLAGDGRRLKLPLPRIRSAGAEPLLLSSVPGLSAHSLDSVRDPEPRTNSILRTRWRLYGAELPALYGILILFLLFTLGGLAFSWDFVNYLRISRRHFTATGLITEITKEDSGKDERVWTRVQYVASNGQTVRLHRKVLVSFADKFKKGDEVQVDYLPGNPRVGRIPGWDMDGRMWVYLLLTAPLVFVMYRATRVSLAKWLRPLRDRLAWVAKGQTGRFGFSGANLAELYVILPDRHRGTFILKPPSASQKKPGLWAWSRWFRRAGIEGRAAEGKFLILNPDQSRRMLSRVGGGNPFPGDYMVLDTAGAEDAEKILHERLANPNTPANEPATDHIVLSCIDNVVGPVTEQRWSPPSRRGSLTACAGSMVE